MNEVVIKPSLQRANSYRVGLSAASFSSARRAASASLQLPPPCSAITKPACFRQKDPEFLREPVPKNVDAIVIDSLPALKDPEDQQTLCAWIRENPELHFVILSRGVLPAGSCRSAYRGFCSSSRPEICCLTAIPCVFFWKRMAAHQRKQRSTSSSTILSATRWP